MNYAKEFELRDIIKRALKEDIGRKDITSEALIPANKSVKAVILAKEECVICGLGQARLTFKTQDKNIRFQPLVSEGDFIRKGKVIARISGRARSILTAERVALNFLSLLSGIATTTRKFVHAVRPYKARIIDTRKTIPGLRLLEKYAVRIGGGFNHRLSLDEMALVKDNHLKVIKGYKCLRSLERIKRNYQLELEAKNLREFKQALSLKPDIIMLDNMSIQDMKKAAAIRNKSKVRLEASGGITLKNAKKIASTGVDTISVGALTHSVSSVDISLEII
jgi:nicotinate-nucleotide pyrophosphorylase (carboxylating)